MSTVNCQFTQTQISLSCSAELIRSTYSVDFSVVALPLASAAHQRPTCTAYAHPHDFVAHDGARNSSGKRTEATIQRGRRGSLTYVTGMMTSRYAVSVASAVAVAGLVLSGCGSKDAQEGSDDHVRFDYDICDLI